MKKSRNYVIKKSKLRQKFKVKCQNSEIKSQLWRKFKNDDKKCMTWYLIIVFLCHNSDSYNHDLQKVDFLSYVVDMGFHMFTSGPSIEWTLYGCGSR